MQLADLVRQPKFEDVAIPHERKFILLNICPCTGISPKPYTPADQCPQRLYSRLIILFTL